MLSGRTAGSEVPFASLVELGARKGWAGTEFGNRGDGSDGLSREFGGRRGGLSARAWSRMLKDTGWRGSWRNQGMRRRWGTQEQRCRAGKGGQHGLGVQELGTGEMEPEGCQAEREELRGAWRFCSCTRGGTLGPPLSPPFSPHTRACYVTVRNRRPEEQTGDVYSQRASDLAEPVVMLPWVSRGQSPRTLLSLSLPLESAGSRAGPRRLDRQEGAWEIKGRLVGKCPL